MTATKTDEITGLTNDLTRLKDNNQQNTMLSIAQKRKALLLDKLKADPKSFLQYAILTSQRVSFPEEVQQFLEEEVEMQGKLIVVIVDDFTNKVSKTDYFLETDKNRFGLYFSENPPQLLSGSVVRVKGIKLGQNIVLEKAI